MNPIRFSSGRLAVALLGLAASFAAGQTPPDLTADFETDTAGWRASDPAATLSWQATGGATGAYLHGEGSGAVWSFVSPTAWAGDWSGYRALRFDLAIPSRHYADADRAPMVVIAGRNAQSMTWTGPTPLWTWTHYEISLDPASFAVDQATFDAILADVAEVRILAEFTTAIETVGLDNVLLTAAPVTVYSEDLVARFTAGVKINGELDGWRPVDDVTLYSNDDGQPLRCLYCDDWQDGRWFKVASPVAWAGDWRGFQQLRLDLKWTSSGTTAGDDLIRIIGANGNELTWSTTLTKNVWQRIVVPLEAAAFGVDEATFQGVMQYVNTLVIRGEYDEGNDQLWLDNVAVSTTTTEVPPVFATSLVARFGSGDEGWIAFDNAALAWSETGGFSGGAIACTDQGTGTARYASPDAWSGDWRAFRSLRFLVKPQGSNVNYRPIVSILGFNGASLTVDPPQPYYSWSPYTFDLTPETFGVTAAEFEAVMRNVAHLTMCGDLVNGNDTTTLDDVSLIAQGSGAGAPPERFSGFDTGPENWRKGGQSGSDWGLLPATPEYRPDDGNPGGCIALDDEYDLSYWFTPESWAGDWRGHESVSFDLKILSGGYLLGAGTMLAVISVHGALTQEVTDPPALDAWNHYDFALTPAAFGVSQDQFDRIMRDVVMIGVRSEWINGSEKEALDNFRLSKAPEAYWLWLAGYLTPEQLADEAVAAKTADPDGDARSNWDEFLALTVPTDPLSCFAIAGRRTAEGAFVVEYTARSGRVYQVWKSLTLDDDWVAVGPLFPGADAIETYADPAGEPAAFFRVEVGLP